MKNKLVIIAPCYNEEDIIEYSIQKLNLLLEDLIYENLVSIESKICFVNDGSKDKTADIIQKYCDENKKNCIGKLNQYCISILEIIL